MKAKNIPVYLALGWIGFVVITFIGSYTYRWTYARESYHIAECETSYKFANLTNLRFMRWSSSFFVNPRGANATTVFSVYSVDELDKAGLLNDLYQQATTDKELFFGYGNKYDARAVVLLQTMQSPSDGEEPLYCIVGTNKVTVDLLRTDPLFNIAVREGRKSDFAFEQDYAVISWGRYWR